MSETMNEATTTETNGVHPKTANELAIAYEAAGDAAPEAAATPDETVDDAALAAAVIAYEALRAEATAAVPADATPLRDATPLPDASPIAAAPSEGLRLRMKVWTEQATGKRYLMPSAFMRDVVRGQPVTDVMCAYAMRDDDTKLITMTAREWNALPFFYFKEDGPAPRAISRPVDVIVSRRSP